MDVNKIRSGLGKGVQQPLRIRHHQMNVEGQAGQRAQTPDDRRAEAEIGHKDTVHHVQMQHVGPAAFHKGQLLGQMGEITGQNRGRHFHRE